MYGKNDYRYYLEHRLVESDDCLAHYGVKGMQWHKKKAYDESRYTNSITTMTSDIGGTRYETEYATYGRAQKRADRKQLHQHVNETNPYKYDKKKSVSKNIKSNVKTAKDRRLLKKIADSKLNSYYNAGRQPEDKVVVTEKVTRINRRGNGKTSLVSAKKK